MVVFNIDLPDCFHFDSLLLHCLLFLHAVGGSSLLLDLSICCQKRWAINENTKYCCWVVWICSNRSHCMLKMFWRLRRELSLLVTTRHIACIRSVITHSISVVRHVYTHWGCGTSIWVSEAPWNNRGGICIRWKFLRLWILEIFISYIKFIWFYECLSIFYIAQVTRRGLSIISLLVFISFIFGIVGTNNQDIAGLGIFTILNGILGGSILILHCSGNEAVREKLMKWFHGSYSL